MWYLFNNSIVISNSVFQLLDKYWDPEQVKKFKSSANKERIYPTVLNPESNTIWKQTNTQKGNDFQNIHYYQGELEDIQKRFYQDMKRYYPKIARKKIIPNAQLKFHNLGDINYSKYYPKPSNKELCTIVHTPFLSFDINQIINIHHTYFDDIAKNISSYLF